MFFSRLEIPSGNLTWLWKINTFYDETCPFSIAMLVYQRVKLRFGQRSVAGWSQHFVARPIQRSMAWICRVSVYVSAILHRLVSISRLSVVSKPCALRHPMLARLFLGSNFKGSVAKQTCRTSFF